MRKLSAILFVAVLSLPAAAQDVSRLTTLTLDEAVALAKKNNPTYLQTINNRNSQALGIRSAYAALFPNVSSSFGVSWRQGGQEVIAGVPTGNSFDVLGSNYGFGVGMNYSYANILQPKFAKALTEQADEQVVAQEQTVRQQVTSQYWTAVQAVHNADLQDSLVGGQKLQYDFARAKEQIGSGISLDTKNAEVQVRRQELAALQAHNQADIQIIQLFQIIGVPAPGPVRLTTELPVVEPTFKLADLLAQARTANGTLNSTREGVHVAEIGKKQQRSNYIPSVNLGTGINGTTNMQTNAVGDARKWPFGFTRSPYGFSAGFSLPIWNGFGRENSIEAATIRLANAQQQLRLQELSLNTLVSTQLSQLQADYRAVQLQTQIVATANEALLLARERYRIGSTPYTDLSLALDRYQTEQNALLTTTYAYHRTFAQLEAAVGKPLR